MQTSPPTGKEKCSGLDEHYSLSILLILQQTYDSLFTEKLGSASKNCLYKTHQLNISDYLPTLMWGVMCGCVKMYILCYILCFYYYFFFFWKNPAESASGALCELFTFPQ